LAVSNGSVAAGLFGLLGYVEAGSRLRQRIMVGCPAVTSSSGPGDVAAR
jgi:hypothetical protein